MLYTSYYFAKRGRGNLGDRLQFLQPKKLESVPQIPPSPLAIGAAVYIWAGMLAVGVSQATAVILGAVFGFLIFLYVRLFGEDTPRRQPRVKRD